MQRYRSPHDEGVLAVSSSSSGRHLRKPDDRTCWGGEMASLESMFASSKQVVSLDSDFSEFYSILSGSNSNTWLGRLELQLLALLIATGSPVSPSWCSRDIYGGANNFPARRPRYVAHSSYVYRVIENEHKHQHRQWLLVSLHSLSTSHICASACILYT